MAVTAELTQDTFPVAERCSVEVFIRADGELKTGDEIGVQFPNSWLLISGPSFTRDVQTADPDGDHHVAASADGARLEVEISKRNRFFPEGRARHGRIFTAKIVAGIVPAGAPVKMTYSNTPAPYITDRDEVHVWAWGQAAEKFPQIVTEPGPAVAMRLVVPSGAEPGQEFEVLISSLDRFENRSSTRYENQTLELVDGGPVAEGLSFTGGLRVPVTLKDEGVYRFRLGETLSNAVRVGKGVKGPYWGDIHVHTGLSCDGQGNDPHGYARDVSGLDFSGTCDHAEDLGDGGYQRTLSWARETYHPGKYVSFLCDERNPDHWTGHHNAYFRDEKSFLNSRLRPGCFPRSSVEESLESTAKMEADAENCMLLPHHTGMGWRTLPKEGIGCAVDLDAVEDDKGLRPAMEIYGHHGQSELYAPGHILAYEYNRMRNPERRSNTSVPGPFYAQAYWIAGRRLGAIGSSDEHSGQGGRRHGGIAGVLADELTREGIFDAIKARRCYATTGERILAEFDVDGVGMGGVGRRKKGAKLPIRFKIWGTDKLIRVDVLRHRFDVDDGFKVIESISPRLEPTSKDMRFTVDGVPQMTMEAAVELEEEFTGPAVYYARASQMPLEWPGMAWTSPIWIDPE